MLWISILLLLFYSVVGNPETRVACSDTRDCLKGKGTSWCATAGIVCLSNYCHHLPGLPCSLRTHICQEANKTCQPKFCRFNRNCDNGNFCDGTEKCVNRQCVADQPPPCHKDGGVCIESNQSCLYPSQYRQWKNKSFIAHKPKTAAPKPRPVTSNSIVIEENHWNHSNTSSPSWHHHQNNDWIPWVVIGIAVVIFFVLVFLMVAVANRQWTPVPTQNAVWLY